eukprot:852205-Pleurochrysis_carterae.AAC.1
MLGSIAASDASGGRRDSRASRGAAEVRAGATHTADAQPPPTQWRRTQRDGTAPVPRPPHDCGRQVTPRVTQPAEARCRRRTQQGGESYGAAH